MDLAELKLRVARGEDSTQQFKENVHHSSSLAAEMVAFSNHRGGNILIGVADDKTLIGLTTDEVARINQLISNVASHQIRNPISVDTENVAISDERVVIVLHVPEGFDKPYFDHQGVIWLKVGSDKRRLHSKEELRRFFQEMDILHADEVPTRAGIKALNMEFFTDFFEKNYEEVFPESESERLRLLENMNLAQGENLNLAGLLLFGKYPQKYKPECMIKAIHFRGIDIEDQYIDSEDFEGSFPSIFRDAMAFIMRGLWKIQGDKSVNTVGDPEIPRIVLEELLVNALIHRDYFIKSTIKIFVFYDRIEIISPGCLPNHLTVQKIRMGSSVLRNPILVSFVAKGLLPYRGIGTGVKRALRDWPHIKFIDDREGLLFKAIIGRVSIPGREIERIVTDDIV